MTGKRVTNENQIMAYMHCKKCLEGKPTSVSPKNWAKLSVGWTEYGIQVWCDRHGVNICNIDFEGHTHPADVSRKGER